MAAAIQKLLYQPPDGLDKHISGKLMDEVRDILPQYGMPTERLAPLKPWMLAATLGVLEATRQGYSQMLGIDTYFLARAKSTNKPIVELESIEIQISIFESFAPQEQEVFLQKTIDGIKNGSAQSELDEIRAAWRTGDVRRLEKLIPNDQGKDAPVVERVMEKVVFQRNAAMASKIEEYLNTGRVHFVAVGAVHFAGRQGIVELLRGKGYVVSQR